MTRSLTLAAAQPVCKAHDVTANAMAHAAAVRSSGARVIVFPELSLTGYELSADPVAVNDPALAPLVEACAATRSIALVGAPIQGEDGKLFIAMLKVDGHGVVVAYRKSWLAESELARFSEGDGPRVLDVDGWRMGLGICRDTGSAQHTVECAALGIDVYLAGVVHQSSELPEQEARAVVIARTCKAFVAFASFAGPTGEGFAETAGCSAIWSTDGAVIVRAGRTSGSIAVASLTDLS